MPKTLATPWPTFVLEALIASAFLSSFPSNHEGGDAREWRGQNNRPLRVAMKEGGGPLVDARI
jgi:hypothetical protein